MFCDNVMPSMGANSKGLEYFKMPGHKMVAHTAKTMEFLWKYRITIGQVRESYRCD
jgi:hypothetical protein